MLPYLCLAALPRIKPRDMYYLQAAKLNADCLALRPPPAESEKMSNDIKRIVKEAMTLPGQPPRKTSSNNDIFEDLDAAISKAYHDRSGTMNT